jgi:Restriction endonuclease AspBHI N-terminal/Restriction endonuclease
MVRKNPLAAGPAPVRFDALACADLKVDAIYQGGRSGNAGDDPLPRLLRLSTQGGFRWRGNLEANALSMVMLKTSMDDPDWPDSLDPETGLFTYFGDNKSPGKDLHDTGRGGNALLRQLFTNALSGREGRAKVPPIFLFAGTGAWRDVEFIGLAVPGLADQPGAEDLVAVWKLKAGKRFQNYRARFTVLNVPTISRVWLDDVIEGRAIESEAAPPQWLHWIESGRCEALRALRALEYRSKKEQLPGSTQGVAIIETVHRYFAEHPHDFEHCAAALVRMCLPNVAQLDVTRPSRDGGRDAVGQLRLGVGPGSILIDFALEAKCYSTTNAVGVRELSRLISRLRHRQFGVLVTTSYVDLQAYREIKEDEHPVMIIAATDLASILRSNGLGTPDEVRSWLAANFPLR